MSGQREAVGTRGKAIRHLVACPACSLQYDATKIPPGNRFRCACGAVVKVETAGVKEAAVVRCSSCGGPRREEASNCRFCGSGFTLHERDLNTICPQCLARISRHARFCHSCGVAISPQAIHPESADWPCPACAGERKLAGRQLDDNLSVLECGGCGGLWLGHEIFGLFQQRAQTRQIRWLREEETRERATEKSPSGPLYRRCPVCGKHMSRRNFERRSGVVVDVCNRHGIWMDLGELEAILRWIQDGGLARAVKLEKGRAKDRTRTAALRVLDDPLGRAADREMGGGTGGYTLIGRLVRFLIDSA